MNQCPRVGGKHIEQGYFTLMMDCAELCETSAHLQLSGLFFCAELRGVCAPGVRYLRRQLCWGQSAWYVELCRQTSLQQINFA